MKSTKKLAKFIAEREKIIGSSTESKAAQEKAEKEIADLFDYMIKNYSPDTIFPLMEKIGDLVEKEMKKVKKNS